MKVTLACVVAGIVAALAIGSMRPDSVVASESAATVDRIDGYPGARFSGHDIALWGDSLAVGARRSIVDELGGASIHYDAIGGRGLDPTESRAALTAMIAYFRANSPDIVIIELGTNDSYEAAGYQKWVERAVDLAANSCVVWVNTQGWLPGRSDRLADINMAIDRAASSRSWVHVANWAQVLADDPGLHASDRIHLNARGNRAMSELISTTVEDRCVKGLPEPAPITTSTSLLPWGDEPEEITRIWSTRWDPTD